MKEDGDENVHLRLTWRFVKGKKEEKKKRERVHCTKGKKKKEKSSEM